MSRNFNYNAITLELLYRNYMDYVRNSTRILNNTVSILYNQQQTYNDLITNYNNNYRYSYLMNMPQYYRYRPVTPENNNQNINLPTINDINTSVSFLNYSEIDVSTNTSCPITQRDFNANDMVIMLNRCKHIYEPQAIMQWFSRCSLCPLCRRSIINNETDENNETDVNNETNVNNETDVNNQPSQRNNMNESTNSSLTEQLANLISQEINRDLDFSGNILIEFGIPPAR